MKVVAFACLLAVVLQQHIVDAQSSEARTYDCDTPCPDTQFCGKDLQCHTTSCDAWYEMAHPFYTHYNEDEPLVCTGGITEDRVHWQELSSCGSDLPLAVEYVAPNASTYQCPQPSREEQLAGLSFSIQCTARPDATTGFICYEQHLPDITEYLDITQTMEGFHSYKLYVEGYELTEGDGISFPSTVGEFRSLGEGGDPSLFNETTAAAAMYSRAFKLNEDPLYPLSECEGGCLLSEFCGTDGKCHSIECNAYWEYGAAEFTGRYDDNDVELICTQEFQNSTANPCGDSWPAAVRYQCRPSSNFVSESLQYCANDDIRQVPFRRMCTAKPNPTQEFVCFDMTDVPNGQGLDVAEYVETTTSDPECRAEEVLKQPEDPNDPLDAFHFQTHRVERPSASSSFYYELPVQSVSWMQPLDEKALDHAMLAKVVGSAPENPDSSTSSGCPLQAMSFAGLLIVSCYLLI